MSVCTCCMCLNKFEGEEPPILMMDRAGNPCVLCPDCTAIVDAIAGTPDSPDRAAAIEALGHMDVKNPAVANELVKLIERTDAPLDDEGEDAAAEDEAYDEDADLSEDDPLDEMLPVPEAVNASNLSLYLGLGCLGVALILFLLLRFLL